MVLRNRVYGAIEIQLEIPNLWAGIGTKTFQVGYNFKSACRACDSVNNNPDTTLANDIAVGINAVITFARAATIGVQFNNWAMALGGARAIDRPQSLLILSMASAQLVRCRLLPPVK